MACKGARKTAAVEMTAQENQTKTVSAEAWANQKTERLLFGVDSRIQSNDILQNNLTEFEWVTRNKVYPNFWGRYLVGENALTKEEIDFLHSKGCKIAAVYTDKSEKQTEEQGRLLAKKIDIRTLELGIPEGTAIFLELGEKETVTRAFMRGFASMLITEGFIPGFKANTDAKFAFDREFSRGMQFDKEIFRQCLIWAVVPTVKEYNAMTTTHLIHPDRWMPYVPSGLTRKEIAIWQYGRDCHPIEDDMGNMTTFNLNLVRNEQVIVERMF